MRNTIYARAGREFKDRDLRAYFDQQPWYRPTATPAKLSPLDEKNLARIKNWEPLAKARADLRALVPAWGANVKLPPRADCEADAKGVLSDGGGGDCDEPIEKVAVFTLKGNKLVPVASFTLSAPSCVD